MYDTALCGNAEILGHSREPFFNRAPEHFCSHKHTPFKMEDHAPAAVLGADGGYIAWNVFEEYAKVGSIILKDTVLRMLDALLAEKKTVVTNLPAQGVVSLTKQGEQARYVLHTLYASPVKRGENVEIIEDLIPIHGTTLEIRVPETVKTVRLVPENKELPFTVKNGVCRFTIPEFSCKQVTVLEYNA